MRQISSKKIKLSNSDLKKGIFIPDKLTEDLSEEIGLHIGDGSMNFYKNKDKLKGCYQLRGHIEDDKDHYNDVIKPLYEQVYSFTPSLRNMKSTGVYGFQLWSDGIVNFKNKIIGLPLGNKLNISIPSIFYNKTNLLISLIRGIFDTDGCVYLEEKRNKLYPRLEFKTVSPTLSEQIKTNLIHLGIRATKYVLIREEDNWNNLYTVAIRGDKMLNKTFKIIEPKNPKHIKKFEYFLANS